jgi:hypothetical protein
MTAVIARQNTNVVFLMQVRWLRRAERFQSSNHMGCSKRPHPWDGKSTMQLWSFMESVVRFCGFGSVWLDSNGFHTGN